MTTEEKLLKLRKLADAMYYAAQHLTTDASRLHKAMEDYHQFVTNEYHKEEPTIPDIVDEHFWEMLGEEPVSEDMWKASKQYALRQVLASTDAKMTEQAYLSLRLFSGFEIAVAHKDGANWQMQQVMKEAVDGLTKEYLCIKDSILMKKVRYINLLVVDFLLMLKNTLHLWKRKLRRKSNECRRFI